MQKHTSWTEREAYSADLTVNALIAASDAIVATMNKATDSYSDKHTVFNKIVVELGSFFDKDIQGNPTLSHHPHHNKRPPATLDEMKKRFQHLRNGLSGDIAKQDLCESTMNAALAAGFQAMTKDKASKKH